MLMQRGLRFRSIRSKKRNPRGETGPNEDASPAVPRGLANAWKEVFVKALTAVALATGLMLHGCASDPYVTYGTYYDGYRPYAYEAPYYSYYGYPSAGPSFYFRDDDDYRWRHRWRDRGRDEWGNDSRDRDRDGRGDDGRDRRRDDSRARGPIDTRHGEAGNEAGMR
jgi:hypothetical protein